MKIDIEKLKGEFIKGYRIGSASFYVAFKNFSMLEKKVFPQERASWSDLWCQEDIKFESFIRDKSELQVLSNKYFFV